MGFFRILLYAIEVVVCILLVGVILLQKSKDSGLGMAFGAGMGESLFGAQAGNVMTRITIILAAVFLVNTTLLAFVQPRGEASRIERLLPDTPAEAVPPMGPAASVGPRPLPETSPLPPETDGAAAPEYRMEFPESGIDPMVPAVPAPEETLQDPDNEF